MRAIITCYCGDSFNTRIIVRSKKVKLSQSKQFNCTQDNTFRGSQGGVEPMTLGRLLCQHGHQAKKAGEIGNYN